jgi:uncharacterized membrane protein
MSLAPLLQASLAIQVHVLAAVIAIVLGVFQFVAPKGTVPHRIAGWIWVVLLSSICISSFFIPATLYVGPVSVFHALSVYTLYSLAMGVLAARQHKVTDHKSYMVWIYGLSIILSAVIAVLTGGVLQQVFFPQ